MAVKKEEKIVVELGKAEAIVLFEFLSRFSNKERLDIEDQAEARVLWDIQCGLESILHEPLVEDYDRVLQEARAKVRAPDE